MKRLLKKRTATPLKGILSGTISTAVLQSSSVVTLLVIGLVGVGMVSFPNSIWVIIGTNIWSTITARIISIFGFKLNLQAVALPIIAVTGLLMVFFIKRRKIHYSAILVFGFGLLLFGIHFIKDSFGFIGAEFNIETFLGLPAIAYVLVGLIITALVQSTAVCNTITFTAMSSGLIWFKIGMMMVIWSNIGTTVTAILGSLNGSRNQKQVAGIHVLYNLATASLVLIFFQPIHFLLYNILQVQEDVMGLAIFHTFFNIVGAMAFYPFIKIAGKLIKKIIPDKYSSFNLAINTISPDEWETAIYAVKQDIKKLFLRVVSLHLTSFHLRPQKILQKKPKIKEALQKEYIISPYTFKENYENIKKLQSQLINYCIKFESDQITKQSLEDLSLVNKSIINFTQSAKMIKDIHKPIETLYESDKKFLQEQFQDFKQRIARIYWEIYKILEYKEDHTKTIKYITLLKKHIYEQDKKYTETMSSQLFKTHLFDILKHNPNSMESYDMVTINRYIFQSLDLLLNAIKNRLFTLNDFSTSQKFEQESFEHPEILETFLTKIETETTEIKEKSKTKKRSAKNKNKKIKKQKKTPKKWWQKAFWNIKKKLESKKNPYIIIQNLFNQKK